MAAAAVCTGCYSDTSCYGRSNSHSRRRIDSQISHAVYTPPQARDSREAVVLRVVVNECACAWFGALRAHSLGLCKVCTHAVPLSWGEAVRVYWLLQRPRQGEGHRHTSPRPGTGREVARERGEVRAMQGAHDCDLCRPSAGPPVGSIVGRSVAVQHGSIRAQDCTG